MIDARTENVPHAYDIDAKASEAMERTWPGREHFTRDSVIIAYSLGYRAAMEWRPMDTAPKDGTTFLAYTDEDGVELFHWQSHVNVGWRDSFINVYREGDPRGPKGWMPTPKVRP